MPTVISLHSGYCGVDRRDKKNLRKMGKEWGQRGKEIVSHISVNGLGELQRA